MTRGVFLGMILLGLAVHAPAHAQALFPLQQVTYPPLDLTLNVSSAQVPCDAAAGANVATASTSGGNGSPVSFSATGGGADFTMSGANVVVASGNTLPSECASRPTYTLKITVGQ